MGIALFGLCHKASVIRKGEGYDCAGNIVLNSNVVICPCVCCRFSLMFDTDQMTLFGNFSNDRWKVTLEYTPDLQDSDFLVVAPGKYPNINGTTPQYYRVLWKIHRQSHTCCNHHTSATVELDRSL